VRSASWDGYDLQQTISQVARARCGVVVQGAGDTRFFGRVGASRLRHELDTGLHTSSWVGFVEVKATLSGPTKNDVLIFDGKTVDIYIDRLLHARSGPHFRVIVSATSIDARVRAFCYQRGIVCVEPDLLPLPVLAKLLENDAIERLFSDVDLEEADRLFISGSAPMEQIWKVQGNSLSVRLRRFSAATLDDVAYLQTKMTSTILDHLAVTDPDWERRHLVRLTPRSVGLALVSESIA